jgi:uncharacterized protein YbjT (DUF2867 family)
VGVDLLDRSSLDAAYDGADTVVLHLPLVYDARALTMAGNVAGAAAAAGVTHLVINTSAPLPPQPIGVPFIDACHRAAAADVPRVTVLQPTLYLENLTGPWMTPQILADGVVGSPLPVRSGPQRPDGRGSSAIRQLTLTFVFANVAGAQRAEARERSTT